MLRKSSFLLVSLLALSFFVLPGCQGTREGQPNYLTGQSSAGPSNLPAGPDVPAQALRLKHPSYGR